MLGFVVGSFLNPFPLFLRLVGFLLSLVPLFLRPTVRAWSVECCLEPSWLVLDLICLELRGLEVRASYNPISSVFDFMKVGYDHAIVWGFCCVKP